MASRQDRKRQARELRKATERRDARSAARRRRTWLAAAVGGLALAVTVAVVLLIGGGSSRPAASTIAAIPIPPQRTTDLDRAVRLAGARRISYRYDVGINEHTTGPVAYATNPPTNGPHAPTWSFDGNYAGLPAPPTGQVVHAQEHGRIVLQYRPGLPRKALAQLVALFEESPEHVLLVENATRMPCDVAATTWGRGVLCPQLNARSFDALRVFRDRYRDMGPETVA